MEKEIEILVLSEHDDLPLYGTDEAAGSDVRAHLPESIIIRPGEAALIPTGICCEIPTGYEIQVRPRSGLALKNQVTVLNSPGTIDADYRGEIKIILINHGKNDFTVLPGMRIAQLVVAPVMRARFIKKESLAASSRGNNGFGHTGID